MDSYEFYQKFKKKWYQFFFHFQKIEIEEILLNSFYEACCWVTLVVSDSVRPHRRQPTRMPVPGILQARTLEWVAISFSNAGKWKVKSESEVAQSCLTLSDPRDCSLPGSSIHGIFQARVLEWGCHCLLCLWGQHLIPTRQTLLETGTNQDLLWAHSQISSTKLAKQPQQCIK